MPFPLRFMVVVGEKEKAGSLCLFGLQCSRIFISIYCFPSGEGAVPSCSGNE